MAKKIITITRQYGSGGREIGETLAKRLGVQASGITSCWTLRQRTAAYTRLTSRKATQRRTNSFLYLLSTTYGQGGVPFDDDALFLCTAERYSEDSFEGILPYHRQVRGLCPQGLQQCGQHLHHGSPGATRINRAINAYGIGEKHAAEYVKRMDKQRISYYNYYTDKRWGVPENYELCLDSSALGIEGSVDLLEDFIKKYFKE